MKWPKNVSHTLVKLLAVIAVALMGLGCVAGAANRTLSETRLRRAAKAPSSVELLSGKPSCDYQEIGVVESSRAKKLTPDLTARMMKELQTQAAALGADAVIDVRKLADRHEGFNNNPRTPFPSVMQGEWKTYFFRGTAVRLVKR